MQANALNSKKVSTTESNQQFFSPGIRPNPSGTNVGSNVNITDSEVSQAFYPPNFKSTEKRHQDSIDFTNGGGGHKKLRLEPQ